MSWVNPLPLRIVPTSDSESFKIMPALTTGLPLAPHPGAFGVRRKHHTHEGVDLYAPAGTSVFAVEPGRVVRVMPFTGPRAGLPWWRDTQAVFIEGVSGVVVYGEVLALVEAGDLVEAGQAIATVEQVLARDKGRPLSMLHLELHCHGSRSAPNWLVHDTRPSELLDPTPFLPCGTTPCNTKLTNTFNPFMYCDAAAIAEDIVRGLEPLPIPQVLQSRIQYLAGLPNIGAGWIGGGNAVGGLAPTESACQQVIGLLEHLGAQPTLVNNWTQSTVLLGPLVTGGVCVELCLAAWNARFILMVHNDGLVEQTYITAGDCVESSYPAEELNSKVAIPQEIA